MKKVNLKNLIKLIIMGGCIVLLLSDFVTILVEIFKGVSLGLSVYGVIIDTVCLILLIVIYDDLFGDEDE